ncbi:type I restriction endonuclease subunit R [Streptococcus hyointestinalis]|uniref:Type I restriction enzyme endonuclease subunit n=1 Tax=Streptococcus hyointestinalis TaxID=1337 RepID=A0A380JZU3_9STRE|nr:type I restriction endonuclease subunit R [Streptococcus hyointestinalis]SUN58054.1 type I restriction-modification system, restriction subunit R [Streptococcus hyointestinalis]SUN59946.1 type I restriction-modification system, restriction subunit R [Streptococcus hyointestinalis]
MAELESVLEQKLIDQLCQGESQWTYRPDIRTEEELWDNFRYILEQNNKAKLNDGRLTDSEFAKIKNDLSHASFYDAGKWLVGENGQVYVHVQRGNEPLHLLVLNNEHIAGGTSVYEVINQYQAFGEDDARDRRFDVTLLINGIPMIHIELKNKDHSYMDGFHQIKKYIAEGKFRGLFSNVQMFVISNGVDTKYFSAARDNELNKKFLTGWIDHDNQPVPDFIDFAKAVLKIPEAHEMVTKYIVLDNDKKKLLILRPYQIHAIEAMRDASKKGKSGFIWHTTGSGKTMTSYKATRNLLMDIPSIEKTIFLIDRKDLDVQTKLAFQSYADNDTIDVDDTENVNALIKKLTDGRRQMIVTTRQKMQTMINKRLKEGTTDYNKIRALKVAFVVDECHRAVTPQTKRELEAFFANSLWFGFTGTPIFEDNKYEQKGDLAQTTKQLYGDCLHSYTIKEAIHDGAVLGFMVETLGKNGLTPEEEERTYGKEAHMRQVLDVILNKSFAKFGMEKGRGETYEAMFTVSSIEQAQKYYELIKRIKAGQDELKISEDIRRALPDFPKVAITYSVTENDEASKLNQDKMKEALDDYNDMFGTNYNLAGINAYNANLNDRLARKEKKYLNRSQQLDIVIVVDRLLTGFDVPCLSTLFIDRQPMSPQNLIQAFSRTNRLFDTKKQYGQIVTFQSPQAFKEAINSALALYSRGGEGEPLAEDFETVKEEFITSLKIVRLLAETPQEVISLSKEQKIQFIADFRGLDHSFNHLKAFTDYDPHILTENHFSQEEYEDYAAVYKNVLAELKTDEPGEGNANDTITDDYELVAVDKITVDYDYIIDLISGFVDSLGDVESEAEYEKKLAEIKDTIAAYSEDNPKLGALLEGVLEDIINHKEKYENQDVSIIVNQLRQSAIEKEIRQFSEKWFVDFEDVKYEAYHFKDGKLANENKLKEKANYAAYKEATEEPVKKFKFFSAMIKDFKDVLMPEIAPLFN